MHDPPSKHTQPMTSKSLSQKPAYLLAIIFIAIFLAEAIIMIALNLLPPLDSDHDVLLDSFTLVIVLSPVLYFFAFTPLKNQIIICEEAEREKDELIMELHSALLEVKTLQGIIPICASCKNIRNDKGFWEKVESYFSSHTDAVFSHGLCPDCMRKLYPDTDDPNLS